MSGKYSKQKPYILKYQELNKERLKIYHRHLMNRVNLYKREAVIFRNILLN
jgi:hypothetical protein